MQASSWLVIVVFASLCTAMPAAAQPPVGALAIDERQGEQWGWAVDYETAAAAQARALDECGPECSVVLTFGRCAAYAADQDAGSTAVGWAEAYASASAAQEAGAVRVPFPGWRFGLHRSGVGLQRAGGRGGAEPGPGGPASDPAGPGGRGFRPWWSGRSVRSADACGDTAVAVVARRALDGLSGRCVGRSVAVYRCGRSSGGDGSRRLRQRRFRWRSSLRRRARGLPLRGQRGAGGLVLAVDHEQHEPCGVRGVSCVGFRTGCSASWRRREWRRCAHRRVLSPRPTGTRVGGDGGRRELPALGSPARLCRALAQPPAGTCAGVPARSSGTAPSAPRWWCWRTALWRWVATR